MTDLFPKDEYDVDVQNRGLDEKSQVPEAVGVYDRPEESGLPAALIAAIVLILLVVAAAVLMLLIL